MSLKKDHTKYMMRCVNLAEIALNSKNPPVGSVIEYEGKIIGIGIESGKSSHDITRHAEIEAVRDAISKGHEEKLKYASLYTTHEPCIMCSYVIRHHKIKEVIYGTPVGLIGGHSSTCKILKNEQVPKWGTSPTITDGVCEEICQDLTIKYHNSLGIAP